MKKRLLAGLMLSLLLLVTTGFAHALTSVGGYNFDDNAFVDSLVSSNGTWTHSGSTLESTLVGSNPNDYAFGFGSSSSITLSFDDNFLRNGAGFDLAVFELGTAQTFSLLIGSTTISYTGVSTGYQQGGFDLIAAIIDLDDFGLEFGSLVSMLTLYPAPTGDDPADFTVIGALNSLSLVPEPSPFLLLGEPSPFLLLGAENGAAPVPEPSTLLLLGSGLAGLAFVVRRRRKD